MNIQNNHINNHINNFAQPNNNPNNNPQNPIDNGINQLAIPAINIVENNNIENGQPLQNQLNININIWALLAQQP